MNVDFGMKYKGPRLSFHLKIKTDHFPKTYNWATVGIGYLVVRVAEVFLNI